jgi:hypothetical protein
MATILSAGGVTILFLRGAEAGENRAIRSLRRLGYRVKG